MDIDRVAHVFAGPSSRGSGYVIARQLVLTADHVIEASPGALTVLTIAALRAGGRRVPARVTWRDVKHDLALLAIDEPTDATPVALGKLAGLEPVPVEAVGFPDATVANGSADTLAVHGDCLADSGRVHGRVQMRVGSLVPRRREDWRGLSGAALFAGDFLVGVLRQVPEAFGEGVLDASALAPVLSDANLSTLLRDSGVAPTPRSVDADDARPFGASGFAEVAADYSNALVASFRLDGAGLAVDGASRHALALGRAYGGTRYLLPGDPQPVSLADLPARRLRLALVGPPGSGKSITLKRLLVDVAKRERRVPVYLRLAEFAAAGDISAPALVRAFAAQAERQGVPQADVRLFDRLLTYGLAAVALDGLDEVGGRTLREAVVSAIGALSDSAPNARIVIASRPAEFAETPLPRPTRQEVPPFVEAQTTPLGDDQIRHFLRDSFDDDGHLWRVIRESAELIELARTPLLLTLIAMLSERGNLPTGSLALYQALVETAVERWEATKATAPAGGNARRALEELALAMHQRDSAAAPMPEAGALRALGGSEDLARPLLRWLTDRSGLLIRHEQRGATLTRAVVQFGHLQVQEYLAGCALARRVADNEATGLALLDGRKTNLNWEEPQRFAAAELAQREAYGALTAMVRAQLAGFGSDGPWSSLVAATVLAQADADFFPAPELETAVVRALTSARDFEPEYDFVKALCALAPREASFAAVRSIARQTPDGLLWLGLRSPLPARAHQWAEAALAACASTVCNYADRAPDAETAAVVDWALAHSTALTARAAWVPLASSAARLRGATAAHDFLRNLALDTNWLSSVAPAQSTALLAAVERITSAAEARALAIESIDRGDVGTGTAGYATYLEDAEDDAAVAAADRYYDSLARAIPTLLKSKGTISWEMLPLWPSRDSSASDALRRAVLRNSFVAWFIMPQAIRDPRWRLEATEAWKAIVRRHDGTSRRNDLVSMMVGENDLTLSVPLLLDALDNEMVGRWMGDKVVRRLFEVRRGDEARTRLTAARPHASSTGRTEIDGLIALCDELASAIHTPKESI